MAKYLDQIPKDKAAHQNEAGQTYRSQQLQQQLPAHDFDPAYCNQMVPEEQERMEKFSEMRDEDAAGQGAIKEKTQKELTQWVGKYFQII